MKPSFLLLAAKLLDLAADEFENHGCNEIDFSEILGAEERKEFALLAWIENGSPENDKPRDVTQDWWAMRVMAGLLRKQAEQEAAR
jgi:hypothetical protein